MSCCCYRCWRVGAIADLGISILHFITFVIACVETAKRNRSKHTTQVVYVTGNGYPAPPYGQGGQALYPGAAPVSNGYHNGAVKV